MIDMQDSKSRAEEHGGPSPLQAMILSMLIESCPLKHSWSSASSHRTREERKLTPPL